MVNNKPEVKYTATESDFVSVGKSALLHGKVHNHPVANLDGADYVKTSPVIRIFDGGFETQNTVYHAVE